MLLTIVSFLLVLGFLVFVHELGHFLAARQMGVRVERFSIGFPPKAFGRTIGETEYVVSWIPIGGYVKMEGQNIEDENPNDPRNYAAKSKLQRLYILAAGPVMNLIVALLLMPLVYMVGVEQPAYRQAAPRLASVEAATPAAEVGFQAGDRIVQVGDTAVASWNELYRALERAAVSGDPVRFTVQRDSGTAQVSLPVTAFTSGQPLGWVPSVPAEVGGFSPDSPAHEAGMQRGDRIVAVQGDPIDQWRELSQRIQSAGGGPVTFTVERGGTERQITVTPRDTAEGRLVIGITPPTYSESRGFLEAIGAGTRRLGEITAATFVFLGQMLTGHGSLDAVGGPVKIGAVIGEAARSGLVDVVFLTAVISLQLGIFNLLPIPALDGGHITLLAVEAVKRGPLSPRVREVAQLVGFSLLILLILVVTYNDVLNLLN